MASGDSVMPPTTMAEESEICHLIRMPDVVFEHILIHLPYDTIAKSRIVCRRFNNVCQRLLNRGFYSAVRFHSKCSKEVKSQLPRRESKRPNHPLARHNNILHAIETRLSLLKMTYCKYIHYNACCFIPGKVVDELFRVLRLVNNTKGNLIPHEVLTELRDISSMAMDYFEEKISPTLRNPSSSSPPQLSPSPSASLAVLSSPFSAKSPSLASSHTSGSAYGALNASMQATLSSLTHCFGETSGTSSMIGGSGSSAFFPYSDDLLDGEMKSAIDSLVTPPQASRSGLCTPTQLVPVPAETLKALVQALRETRGRKSRSERQLAMMQTKLLEVSRKVQDQERTISEQSRLLAEHSVRFSQHSRTIFEIVNNSVTAEVLDMEDSNVSLLSIPDYETDLMEYSDVEPGTDDDGNLEYQGEGGAEGSAKEGAGFDDGLDDWRATIRNQLDIMTESNITSAERKKLNTEEEQSTFTLDCKTVKSDKDILTARKSWENICDILDVQESTPSQADSILRSPAATEPMALSSVLKNLTETDSPGSKDTFSRNLTASNARSTSLKSTLRANVNDDSSQSSTSRERQCSLTRPTLRPRIGRPLKASAASSSTSRQCLSSTSMSTLLSLVESESGVPSSLHSSSSSTLTKGVQTRLELQLEHLQSSPRRASSTLRRAVHRRSVDRNPASGGSPALPSRSRSLSAIRPPLLKTPDGRIIVLRQRSTGDSPNSVGSTSTNSRNNSESCKLDPRPSIHNRIVKGDAVASSSDDSRGIPDAQGDGGGTSNLQVRTSSVDKQLNNKEALRWCGDDDNVDSGEVARKIPFPSIPILTGGRKRKLGIVTPPVKVKDSGLGRPPGPEECSRKTLCDSSVSSVASFSKPGVAALTSDEESDDQCSSPSFKRTRLELLDDLKKNYAD